MTPGARAPNVPYEMDLYFHINPPLFISREISDCVTELTRHLYARREHVEIIMSAIVFIIIIVFNHRAYGIPATLRARNFVNLTIL